VTAAVLAREGALLLHAAGVEFHGRALLFIGPSGAGKSTASALTDGAKAFTRDRAVLVPERGGGWTAWAWQGGHEIPDLPASPHVRLPLAGILRVRQGCDRAALRRHAPAAALASVRESAYSFGESSEEEEARLDAIARLVQSAPIGELHTVRDRPHGDLVAQWLGGQGS